MDSAPTNSEFLVVERTTPQYSCNKERERHSTSLGHLSIRSEEKTIAWFVELKSGVETSSCPPSDARFLVFKGVNNAKSWSIHKWTVCYTKATHNWLVCLAWTHTEHGLNVGLCRPRRSSPHPGEWCWVLFIVLECLFSKSHPLYYLMLTVVLMRFFFFKHILSVHCNCPNTVAIGADPLASWLQVVLCCGDFANRAHMT